jgi:predicted acylesterase/phospholipase RssA
VFFDNSSKKLKKLEEVMDSALSYTAWTEAALQHDQISGASEWKELEHTSEYDYKQIRHRLNTLRALRSKQNHHGLLFALNEGIHGNMGGMGQPVLYGHAKYGTKQLIEEYVDEIVQSLEHIAQLDESEIDFEERLDFFHRASLCYGRTALMLSGGGALGHFHIGVVKALLQQDLLPSVISGASAGSVITAIFGTHTDLELRELIQPVRMLSEAKENAGWLRKLLYGKRRRADIKEFEEHVLNRLVPDLTFQEAYELTGRRINISIAPAELHQTSRLMNAITSPNVYIRTAVMASCAVPGIFPSVMLEAKNEKGERQAYLPTRRWIDGSFSDDLPAKRLARLYDVNHYIGSLINPIVLFTKDGWDHTRIPAWVRWLTHKSASRVARVTSAISRKYTPSWTRFNVAINTIASVLNQEYSANINVYPDFRKFDFRQILSPLSEDELLELVRQGELATWPQIERIRVTSKIEKTLERILDGYGENDLLHAKMKRRKQVQKAVGA